jgi:FAD/FMN-containing dehydrogenase
MLERVSDQDLPARLAEIVGAKGVVTNTADMAAYLQEPRGLFRGQARCIAKPENVDQVARIVSLCNELAVAIVPQGGNTGLVGGQTPDASGAQIVLSLQKLDRIREIDAVSDTMTLEAGVTLARAQETALSVDRYFPLSLASEGSCTIGGNLSTNAGGVHVIAYGSARDLTLGVEAVLANGKIVSCLSKLRKDNTGYDLPSLFIGAEGTLGIITAATLKLFPQPRARATAFVGLANLHAAIELLSLAKSGAFGALHAFELVPRIALDFVLRFASDARDPLAASHPWYALVEFASFDGDADAAATEFLAKALETGAAENAALAASLAQRAALWRLRELVSEAQTREGGSIKHDVAAPVDRIPEFIEEASRLVEALIPGARPVPFGHLGDGNIHFNVSQPVGADKDDFLARRGEVNEIVHGVVRKFQGSISAEHGIGQLKRDLLARTKDPVALETMRAIKKALDPKGILNPGKLF